MKVIIAGGGTGGHLFPAVALGEELRRQRSDTEVLFVGSSAGLEARWLPSSGYKYELLGVHGLRGHGLLERLRAAAEFVLAIFEARGVLKKFPAALVVSAGGYASAPMAVAAILARVPLLMMEQNTRPGLSNRVLWRFARKVCVGFSDTAQYFSPAKVEVTGNPVRFSLLGQVDKSVDNPVQILVLGGSSGAHRLNLGVLNAFKKLGKTVIKLKVHHQTGAVDEALVRSGYAEAGVEAEIEPFIENMAPALADADLIVSRSGAMAVSEIALAARPAILVPYPFHRDRQQEHNASVLEKLGAAIVIKDDEHLADNLARALGELTRDRTRLAEMGARGKAAAHPDAAARIARACFEIANPGEVAAAA